MTRLGLALALLLSACGLARAQVVLPPVGPPTGIACAYNTTPPTIGTGFAAWVQCNSAGALLTASGAGSAGSAPASPSFTAPATGTCADTAVAVTTSSAQLLAAGTRKSVTFENLTTATNVTFVEGATATVGGGMVLQGPAAAGGTGTLYSYSTPPTNAVSAIGSAAATVIVKVCN